MEYLFIYLLQLLDGLEALGFISCLAFIGAIFGFIMLGIITGFRFEKFEANYYSDISTETAIAASGVCKKSLIISFIVMLILSFIPTKQTLLVMGGLYFGKKAVNTVITDDKIKKVNTIINLELDKRIKELKGE